MSPDERAQIPVPECCRSCVHHVRYLRSDGERMVERHECDHPMHVLPHPNCGWHVPRTPILGGPDARDESDRG